MQTKYDVGDKVLIKATVKQICIRENDNIEYALDSKNWCN